MTVGERVKTNDGGGEGKFFVSFWVGNRIIIIHRLDILCAQLRSFWSLACDRQLDSDQGREPKKST
jgi:hypothetical protein